MKVMPIDLNTKINSEVSIQPDGIICLRLGGNISVEEHGLALTTWAIKAREAFAEQKKKLNGNALCIVDISSLRDFDEGSIKVITDLAASSEAIDINTAVFGGTMFTKMGLKTIIQLAGRNNIKHFDTKDAAMAWLRS